MRFEQGPMFVRNVVSMYGFWHWVMDFFTKNIFYHIL